MTSAWVVEGSWAGACVAAPGVTLAGRLRRGATRLSRWWSELRIDVDLPADDLEDELAQLYARWIMSGADLADLGVRESGDGLVFKTRHADGEQFIVLSRLVEVNRRADRHLRSPHAKVAQAYRRRGIASRVYRWWLDAGRNLMSGERQSPHAHQMWMSLARDYELAVVRVQDKRVLPVGSCTSEPVLGSLGTRMVLLGRGCGLAPFTG